MLCTYILSITLCMVSLSLSLSLSLYDAAGEMQSTQVPHSGLTRTMNYITLIPSFWLISYTHIPIPSLYTPPQLSNRVDKPAK
jgi:hypothetical protein